MPWSYLETIGEARTLPWQYLGNKALNILHRLSLGLFLWTLQSNDKYKEK